MAIDLGALEASISRAPMFRYQGNIEEVKGLSILAAGLPVGIGEMVVIGAAARAVDAEVVGVLSNHRVYLLPYEEIDGIRSGTPVWSGRRQATVPVGDLVLGRILDGLGRPLDGAGPIRGRSRALRRAAASPLQKRPITEKLATGVRAVDGLLTLGRGQRVGIFAGAGVGKTTLLNMLLRGTDTPIAVVALVGERGREVAEFCQGLDASTRARTVVIAATSEAPALMRLKVSDVAMSIAEDFRDRGTDVLLVLDSLTRVAMAQREVGLQSGEIASMRGYTPSVFQLLPRLLERAGRTERAAITGLYTVLLDSDDPNDAVGDAARSILDGHYYLARELAEGHHFPAIDIPRSLSRVMPDIIDSDHARVARLARQSLARLERSKDLVSLGAYQPGTDEQLDFALDKEEALRQWLDQPESEWTAPEEGVQALGRLLGEANSA